MQTWHGIPAAFQRTIVVVAAFAVIGPLLLFPDLVPPAWRTPLITLLTVTALGVGARGLGSRPGAGGLWLLSAAVVASWAVMPAHDIVGTRHFAGIGLGVFAMAAVAIWCTTPQRLVLAASLFATASTVILALGFLSTSINQLKFVGYTPVLPAAFFERLPGLKLGLPGLESQGRVNANALAGTALLLLPGCAGLVLACFCQRPVRRIPLAVGIVATAFGAGVLVITLSRTAWLAAGLTALVLGLRWKRTRLVTSIAIVLGLACLWFVAHWGTSVLPPGVDTAIQSSWASLADRLTLFQDAVTRLKTSPLLGVGINQFHEAPNAAAALGETTVAHAHNMLLQVALDTGLIGLCGYLWLLGALLIQADRAARTTGLVGRIGAGAGISLVAVHMFGLADAIALGAKVGLFQWLSAGLVLAASALLTSTTLAPAGTTAGTRVRDAPGR